MQTICEWKVKMEIKSTANQRVKNWKKLALKKERKKQNKYLLDGLHLVKEALKSKERILEILVAESFNFIDELNIPKEIEIVNISDEVAKVISQTPSPQGIFAVLELPQINKNLKLDDGAWLMLDGVQDPGNIGTMVRTADAAGFKGVFIGKGSADIYNPKLVRSMQGSQFHIKVVEGDVLEGIELMHQKGWPVFGSELNDEAKIYSEVGKFDNFGLVMGNEGNGMSKEALSKTTDNLYIPIKGQAESLNVAVAAGILMFTLKK